MKNLVLILLALCLAPSLRGQSIKYISYYDTNKSVVKEKYFLPNDAEPLLRYEAYYPDGSPQTVGYYTDKHPTGTWEYFQNNGHHSMIAEFSPEFKEGHWQYFDSLGIKTSYGPIENGRKHGFWTYLHPNGEVKSQGAYRAGEMVGMWIEKNAEGILLREISFSNEGVRITEYYDNGNKKVDGVNTNKKPNGLWSYYYKNGNLQSRGNFQKGAKEGIWEYFFEDGKLSAHGNFVDDFPDGEWIYYYEDGMISSKGELKSGKKHGNWISFFEGGTRKAEGYYFDGTGEYKEFYPSGHLKLFGTVVNGKRNGKWTFLNEEGSTEGECIYKNGKGIYTGYHPKGQVKVKGKLEDDRKVGRWELFNKKGELEGYYMPYEDGTHQTQVSDGDEKKDRPARQVRQRKLADYVYSTKSTSPFKPAMNEYMALIPEFNPFSVFMGSLPVGIEMYNEERLGHTLLGGYLRDPFFRTSNTERYSSGYYFALRQKFYWPAGKLGMTYIAHELRYSRVGHNEMANIDGTSDPVDLRRSENRYEYAVLLGKRLMKEPTGNGITVDAFLGVGVGYRTYKDEFDVPNPPENLFDDLPESSVPVSLRLGFNIGYSLSLKK